MICRCESSVQTLNLIRSVNSNLPFFLGWVWRIVGGPSCPTINTVWSYVPDTGSGHGWYLKLIQDRWHRRWYRWEYTGIVRWHWCTKSSLLQPHFCTFQDRRDADQHYDKLSDWINHETCTHQRKSDAISSVNESRSIELSHNLPFCLEDAGPHDIARRRVSPFHDRLGVTTIYTQILTLGCAYISELVASRRALVSNNYQIPRHRRQMK